MTLRVFLRCLRIIFAKEMTNYKLRITNWFTPKYKYLTKNKSESYFLTIPKLLLLNRSKT